MIFPHFVNDREGGFYSKFKTLIFIVWEDWLQNVPLAAGLFHSKVITVVM